MFHSDENSKSLMRTKALTVLFSVTVCGVDCLIRGFHVVLYYTSNKLHLVQQGVESATAVDEHGHMWELEWIRFRFDFNIISQQMEWMEYMEMACKMDVKDRICALPFSCWVWSATWKKIHFFLSYVLFAMYSVIQHTQHPQTPPRLLCQTTLWSNK